MAGPNSPIPPQNSPYQPQPPQYSQPPVYGQPYPAYPAQVRVDSGPKKPVSILIFGIFHLVISFFSLGWLAWLTTMLALAMNQEGARPGFNNRSNDSLLLIYEQMGYVQYQIFIIVLGALLTFVLIAAGILLLMGKEKGRDLSVSYGVGSMVLNVLSMVFQIYTGIVLLSGAEAPKRVAEPAGFLVLIGAGLMLFWLIYPLLTLIFMTRKSVKEYLAPR